MDFFKSIKIWKEAREGGFAHGINKWYLIFRIHGNGGWNGL
jgi:hypothetical protein